MDPTLLANAVTSFLAVALARVAQTVVDQAQQKLPEEVNRLWNSIAARFKGNSAAEGSAQDLKANAKDSDNQEAFALQLRKMLKEDPTFARELEKLYRTAQPSAGPVNEGSGAIAMQGGTASGAGGIAVGGNVGGSIILGNDNRVNDNAGPSRDSR